MIFPCESVWDIPTQEEVNAVLAGELAASGGAGEFTAEDAAAVFTSVEDEELEKRPKFLSEYEALTGRSEYQVNYTR